MEHNTINRTKVPNKMWERIGIFCAIIREELNSPLVGPRLQNNDLP
jgi:hypothetical protein